MSARFSASTTSSALRGSNSFSRSSEVYSALMLRSAISSRIVWARSSAMEGVTNRRSSSIGSTSACLPSRTVKRASFSSCGPKGISTAVERSLKAVCTTAMPKGVACMSTKEKWKNALST